MPPDGPKPFIEPAVARQPGSLVFSSRSVDRDDAIGN
jgi:hypothetical protein